MVLDLRTVERALARQLRPGHAAAAQRRTQRLFRLVPHFVGTDAVFRTQRDLDVDVLEAEVFVHLHCLGVEGHDFRRDLLFRAEHVAVVLGEAAHAHQAVQRARRFVAVALAELAVAQRQVAVRAQARVVDLHVARAVHRLQRIGTIFRLGREHVFTIIVPVAGLLPQADVDDLRRLDFVVAGGLVGLAHVLLDLLPDGPAFRVPENQARRFVLEVEQVQLLAQLAVIALLGLLQHVQVLLLVFFLGPGGAVDTLQHLVLRVAAPVRTRQLHQLEDFQLAGRRHVRTAAQVGELAFGVQRHVLVRRDRRDDLGLVVFADRLEVRDGFVARQHLAGDRLVLLGELRHLLLDGLQVVRGERALVREVVVETVVDHGADGDLRFREQFLDGIGQQVGGRVADDVQAFRILVRDDGQVGVFLDQERRVDDLAVDLAGQRGLGQARGDAGRHLGDRHRTFELTARAVREANIQHCELHRRHAPVD